MTGNRKPDYSFCKNCRNLYDSCKNKKVDGGCMFFKFFDYKRLKLSFLVAVGEAQVPKQFQR